MRIARGMDANKKRTEVRSLFVAFALQQSIAVTNLTFCY